MTQPENPSEEKDKKERKGFIKKIFVSESNDIPDDAEYSIAKEFLSSGHEVVQYMLHLLHDEMTSLFLLLDNPSQ